MIKHGPGSPGGRSNNVNPILSPKPDKVEVMSKRKGKKGGFSRYFMYMFVFGAAVIFKIVEIKNRELKNKMALKTAVFKNRPYSCMHISEKIKAGK